MNTDTPMTDSLFTGDMDAETYSHMVTLARRLERDRAKLIAALEDAEFLMREAGQLAGPMQDSFNRSSADARVALTQE